MKFMHLQKVASALADFGYTVTDAALIMDCSRDTARRSAVGKTFGRKQLPKKWVDSLTWVTRVPINLRPAARKARKLVLGNMELGPKFLIPCFHGYLDVGTLEDWYRKTCEEIRCRMRAWEKVTESMEAIPGYAATIGTCQDTVRK